MNEDLVNLFARNLSFNPYVAPQAEPSQNESPIIYSITQHYHHSAHIAAQQPARPASEPPQSDQLTTEIILSRHGVDVASLSPAQITLFKTADASQQMRLIQLWQFYKITATPSISQDLSNYQMTSFEQEEAMAKLRYERQMLEERMSRTGGDLGIDTDDTMSDESSTTPMPMTPIQGGDGRWAGVHVAEPYMSSGYEALARREYEQSAGPPKEIYSHLGTAVGGQSYNHATDPVYKSIADVCILGLLSLHPPPSIRFLCTSFALEEALARKLLTLRCYRFTNTRTSTTNGDSRAWRINTVHTPSFSTTTKVSQEDTLEMTKRCCRYPFALVDRQIAHYIR